MLLFISNHEMASVADYLMLLFVSNHELASVADYLMLLFSVIMSWHQLLII